MLTDRKVLYILAASIVALTAVLAVLPSAATTVFAQQHHKCSLPNGNHFPGQGGEHSNPDSNGGGCPNGLTDAFGNGNN
jgi:hypothetical protein